MEETVKEWAQAIVAAFDRNTAAIEKLVEALEKQDKKATQPNPRLAISVIEAGIQSGLFPKGYGTRALRVLRRSQETAHATNSEHQYAWKIEEGEAFRQRGFPDGLKYAEDLVRAFREGYIRPGYFFGLNNQYLGRKAIEGMIASLKLEGYVLE